VGIVTLTTVGYGDIVPKTTAGRLCGIAIMFTGVAVLGVLAGSLASLFGVGTPTATPSPDEPEPGSGIRTDQAPSLQQEPATLRAQLITVERRLGELPGGGELVDG
jgi:voltage-gated potassium channel